MNKIFKIFIAFSLIIFLAVSCGQKENKAKYVFYFIGDGMGFSHISLAEAYQAVHETGTFGSIPLNFTQFPVMGMATNYSASNPITCSSAAGTALSTGFKTSNYLLGVAPDSTELTSISFKIHDAGYKVGIMSTVDLDHATPGAFYGHVTYRNDYYTISTQLPESGFEFFAGGDYSQPEGARGNKPNAYDIAKEAGYTISYGLDEFEQNKTNGDKQILLQPKRPGLETIKERNTIPYVIDRKEGDLSLASIVAAAIDVLNNEKGFFMMAEGGKIDWAAHSNEIEGTIFEILDMDAAVAVALEFYKQHPDETLIVVTADHETGGLTLGKTKGYVYDLSGIDAVKEAVAAGESEYLSGEHTDYNDSVSEAAQIGWTTTSHTGGSIPIFAIGAHSNLFAGRMDNTDIPKRICEAMGVEF